MLALVYDQLICVPRVGAKVFIPAKNQSLTVLGLSYKGGTFWFFGDDGRWYRVTEAHTTTDHTDKTGDGKPT